MCGIVGYLGKEKALDIILASLKRLEYRGYDSWGFVVYNGKKIFLKKVVGKITEAENIAGVQNGFVGIGHTRWATHGKVSENNAHPHFDCQQKIFLVHNGIIENYDLLKEKLLNKGHKFNSETDTEVICHLLEDYKKKFKNLKQAVLETLKELRGSFALVIFDKDNPELLIGVRLASPLILGVGEKEFILASDLLPINLVGQKFIALNDEEIVFVTKKDFEIKNFTNQQKLYLFQEIRWGQEDIEKGDFPDFMIKEIFETPRAVRNTLKGRLLSDEVKLGGIELLGDKLNKISKIVLTGCGTAYYAGLVGKYVFEELTDFQIEIDVASELRYRNYKFDDKTALIAISQSGETADTLEVIKEAKKKNIITLGIVNVPGSSISRIVDAGIFTYAGPERAVASTKAYYSQITALIMLAIFLGLRRKLSRSEAKNILEELKTIPEKQEKILNLESEIIKIASDLTKSRSMLYLGRKFNYPVALEGALKMKEIAYIHAEAYPGGEMKHGPLALVEHDFPVVFINPHDSLYSKSLSNIEEIKARGAKVITITDDINCHFEENFIFVHHTLELLTPLLTTLPLHLLAYHTAKLLNRNIDRPRNLAKSVTVE